VIQRIEQIMKYDVAGDPMTGLRWTRRTPKKIADELRTLRIKVSRTTVARLLKRMRFSLRVNHKKISSGSKDNRNEQFEYIASLREKFGRRGDPVISVDTKKRELIGDFKNAGATWSREAPAVNDHDFRSQAKGIAIPYGVYDTGENFGVVAVGTSHDTSEFAVASIARWWANRPRRSYPGAKHLLVLADNGGSNAPGTKAWKYHLQSFCDRFGIAVTVAHYPPGASKWNPIEHRLFSEISKNWQGRPLDSYETCLKYIGKTSTSSGLKVVASLDRKRYRDKVQITREQMGGVQVQSHQTLPKWNYTLKPHGEHHGAARR